MFNKLTENLSDNARFLAGNELTIYDFTVAGIIINLICNADARDSVIWEKAWDEHATDRVKKYLEDFTEEMKEYLTERKVGMTM